MAKSNEVINPIIDNYSINNFKKLDKCCKLLPSFKTLIVCANYEELVINFNEISSYELSGLKYKRICNNKMIDIFYPNKSWIRFVIQNVLFKGYRINSLLYSKLINDKTIDVIYKPMIIPYYTGDTK